MNPLRVQPCGQPSLAEHIQRHGDGAGGGAANEGHNISDTHDRHGGGDFGGAAEGQKLIFHHIEGIRLRYDLGNAHHSGDHNKGHNAIGKALIQRGNQLAGRDAAVEKENTQDDTDAQAVDRREFCKVDKHHTDHDREDGCDDIGGVLPVHAGVCLIHRRQGIALPLHIFGALELPHKVQTTYRKVYHGKYNTHDRCGC